MKTNKELKREIIRKNGFFAVILFLILGIILGGAIFGVTMLSGILILLIPVFILPLLFAFSSLILLYREGGNITFSSLGRAYVAFYSPHFRGTFCFLRTILFAILVDLIF